MIMGYGIVIFLIFAGVVIVTALGVGRLLLFNNTSLSNIFSASNKITSREILEERFIRGEINREEFNAFKIEIK